MTTFRFPADFMGWIGFIGGVAIGASIVVIGIAALVWLVKR